MTLIKVVGLILGFIGVISVSLEGFSGQVFYFWSGPWSIISLILGSRNNLREEKRQSSRSLMDGYP